MVCFVKNPYPTSPPSTLSFLNESRALLDIATLAPRLISAAVLNRRQKSDLDGSNCLPVILLPGFASDERYLWPLQLFLKSKGIYAEGWGLGLNLAGSNLQHELNDISKGWNVEPYEGYTPETYKGEGGVPYLCDLATDRIRKRSEQLGSPVTLVGWSLGGYIAREVARDLPEQVAHVVTMGSPVVGGPKYTRAAAFFKKKGYNLDWIESESAKRDSKPIHQPITSVVSKADGIVDWRAAIDNVSPNVEHHYVKAQHLGMGFSKEVWQIALDSIREYGRQ